MIPAFARAWFEQAEADLRAAELSAAGGAYEWACFQSQQAGEKALKAYLYARQECRVLDRSFEDLSEAGRLLDQHYIATRYPNGLDTEVPPTRYYEQGDAETCVRSARSILERVKRSFAS